VLVSVEPSDDGKYRICRETLESLAAACNEEPGLILADYGYAQKQVIAELRQKAQNGPELTEQDVAGRALTTADLISAAREYSRDPNVDSYKRRMMDVNFLRFSKKLYLYSYTSKEFKRAMGEVAARATRTKAALQGCTVIPIDTKYEFYNGDEFDWPSSSKHDGRFYAHLAAGLINHIIQHELLESMLEDAKRLKFVRIRSSAVAVALIVALGGAIGACTEWIGGRVLALSSAGDHMSAAAFGLLTVVWLFVMGMVLPFVFERIMSGFLVGSKPKTIRD
jgi:hypothetical protein